MRSGPAPQNEAAPESPGHHTEPHEGKCTPELPGQRSLEDALAEARVARDEGAQTALDASHPWVRANLERHLDELIASGQEFTSDDLRCRAEVIASSANVVGALIRRASAEGRIVQTGFRESSRPEAHARVIRCWRGVS